VIALAAHLPAASAVLTAPVGHAHFENLGAFEWVLVGLATLIGAWTVWLSVKYTLRPGEEAPDHVKRLILDPPATIRIGVPPPPVPPEARGAGEGPPPRNGR
jgi:hypothetical protein